MASESDGLQCGKCKLTINHKSPTRTEKYIKCDGFCELVFHAGCVRVTEKRHKLITEAQEEMLWLCATCKDRFATLKKNKATSPADCMEVIHMLDTKLKNISEEIKQIRNQQSSESENNKIYVESLGNKIQESQDDISKKLEESTSKISNEIEQKNISEKAKIEEISQAIKNNVVQNTTLVQSYGYAEAVNRKIQSPDGNYVNNIPSIIIKPKKVQNCETTKRELQSNIKPSQIGVGIEKVKEGRDGAIIITCSSHKGCKTMLEEARQKLEEKYEISETKLLQPSVKIRNVQWEEAYGPIENAIRAQNNIFTEEDTFEVQFTKKQHKNTNLSVIILKCNGTAYSKMLKAEKINIGYYKCPVSENIYIKRCYKCNGFRHIAKDCKIEHNICHKCSGHHHGKECQEESIKCVNCLDENRKYNTNYETNHTAFDYSCKSYLKQVELLKKKINYS